MSEIPSLTVISFRCRDWLRVSSVGQSIYMPGFNISDVIREVSRRSGVPEDLIRSDMRRIDVVRARHIAMFIARQHAGQTVTKIGQTMNRDHKTVCSAVNKMTDLVKRDRGVASEVGRIIAALNRQKVAL